MAKAMLHSLDRDGAHRADLADGEILEKAGNNDYIVLTPAGVKCHALFNPFTGYYFADDVYRIENAQGGEEHDYEPQYEN